ncbi:MAG: rhodanese-like domain-containing protein, partial [Gammaproteobacteria bacterium]|nr:rhodanese-like domain-containing protein [Gammaproteobacteria bacterium]
ESDNPPVILDTRSSFEYKSGHLPGAQHFPFWLSYMRADDLDLPKNQPIVVYCAHGPRAVFAKGALKKNGFSNVMLLKGHMSSWKKAKLPVE